MEANNMVNAMLAAIFSFIFPGLGQAYAGYINKGLIFFTIFLILALIGIYFTNELIVIAIMRVIYPIYVAYDAYRLANQG